MSGLPVNDLMQKIASATGWMQHIGNFTSEIADTTTQLSQLKSDAASVIAKLTAAAGGSGHVEPQ